MASYLGYTLSGLEDIAEKELKGKKIFKQRVLFKSLKKEYKSVHRVVELLNKFTFSTLDDISNTLSSLSTSLNGSFRVDCERDGEHPFRSPDVTKAASIALRNDHFIPDLEKPDRVVFVDIVDDHCFVGFLVQDNICRRAYRVKFNNQSIHACLAHAMTKFIPIKKQDVILDPFCKDGVIAIEAYLAGYKKVSAFDALNNNIRNAKINAAMAKVDISFENLDVGWIMTKFKEHTIDFIITNFFVSRRDKNVMESLAEFFRQASYAVKKNIVLVTNKPDIVKQHALQAFSLVLERHVPVGEMHYFILCFQPKKG